MKTLLFLLLTLSTFAQDTSIKMLYIAKVTPLGIYAQAMTKQGNKPVLTIEKMFIGHEGISKLAKDGGRILVTINTKHIGFMREGDIEVKYFKIKTAHQLYMPDGSYYAANGTLHKSPTDKPLSKPEIYDPFAKNINEYNLEDIPEATQASEKPLADTFIGVYQITSNPETIVITKSDKSEKSYRLENQTWISEGEFDSASNTYKGAFTCRENPEKKLTFTQGFHTMKKQGNLLYFTILYPSGKEFGKFKASKK